MGTEAPPQAETGFATESPDQAFNPAVIFLVTADDDEDGELIWTLHLNRRIVPSGITLAAASSTGVIVTYPTKDELREELHEDYEALKVLAQYILDVDGIWSSQLLFDTHTVSFVIGLAYDPIEALLEAIKMVAGHFGIETIDVGVKLPGVPFAVPFDEVSQIANEPTPVDDYILAAIFEIVDPVFDSAAGFAESIGDRIKNAGVQFSESVPPEVKQLFISIFGPKDDEPPTSAPR